MQVLAPLVALSSRIEHLCLPIGREATELTDLDLSPMSLKDMLAWGQSAASGFYNINGRKGVS